MRSKRSFSRHHDLFRERLDAIIDMRHSLVRLTVVIDWQDFDDAFPRLATGWINEPARASGAHLASRMSAHPAHRRVQVEEAVIKNP